MKNLSVVEWVALALVVVGALNWGLVGVFEYDLVASLLGEASVAAKVVYDLVAVSGIYLAVMAVVDTTRQ